MKVLLLLVTVLAVSGCKSKRSSKKATDRERVVELCEGIGAYDTYESTSYSLQRYCEDTLATKTRRENRTAEEIWCGDEAFALYNHVPHEYPDWHEYVAGPDEPAFALTQEGRVVVNGRVVAYDPWLPAKICERKIELQSPHWEHRIPYLPYHSVVEVRTDEPVVPHVLDLAREDVIAAMDALKLTPVQQREFMLAMDQAALERKEKALEP